MNQVVAGRDVIFNCAAQKLLPLSLSDPLFDADVNCRGTLTVLEAIKNKNPQALVIYVSSSTVIGKAEGMVDETSTERPLDIYSANKGVAEKYHWIYHRAHGLKTLSIRFANLFGPYGKGYPEVGFVNYFINLARQDKEIRIFGDGHQKRNLMYVEDAVGLGANMVGILKRIAVVDLQDNNTKSPLTFINPIITWRSDNMQTYKEASLCFPGISAEINRPSAIKINFFI
jgi:nucleoside-diphosphate-sugar epimerase